MLTPGSPQTKATKKDRTVPTNTPPIIPPASKPAARWDDPNDHVVVLNPTAHLLDKGMLERSGRMRTW